MFESQLFACRGFFIYYCTIKPLSTNLLKQLNNNQNLLDRGLKHAAMTGPLMGLIDA